ncbi:hypothetical protein [Streptomyces sp. NRRL WC-3742]|uniref:hypothetical protein n=1 Tax=Streptomyces sp. NRRL WC-3742 TaxID=1463934 RepID=UPI0004C5A10A|nr:hypothetical protein [Streptomyces sp. NRRL WC-3742]
MTSTHRFEASPPELPAEVFLALAEEFFDERGRPVPFHLPPKRKPQDDPFDRHVVAVLERRLAGDLDVLTSGQNTSPDLVVIRPEECRLQVDDGVGPDTRAVMALEVKKVAPTPGGRPSRTSSMDFNSTPPSSTVRVYPDGGGALAVPAYYLIALLAWSPTEPDQHYIDSLALVAGSALNDDTRLYDRITGERTKLINLGSYGDGADRQRPMLIFSNPLGWDWMAGQATLISDRPDLDTEVGHLRHVREISRDTASGGANTFHCYRLESLDPPVMGPRRNPFPIPNARTEKTSPRGRFRIDLRRGALFRT